MDVLNCQVHVPDVVGLESQKLTVGRKLQLNCVGEQEKFDFTKAEVFLDQAPTNLVKIFEVKKINSSETEITMTYYQAGEFSTSDLKLTDGTNQFQLNGPPLNVESVLKPPTDGKQQQPYGPIFPVKIEVPNLYFALLALCLVSAIVYIVFRARKIAYYAKLKHKLKNYDSPIAPDTQFYKSIRLAEKNEYPLDQIEQAFRLYNLRSYHLPMFDLPDRRLIRYFKRQAPQQQSTRNSLLRLLEEFSELKLRSEKLDLNEKQDFIKKLYRYVEQNRGLHNE